VISNRPRMKTPVPMRKMTSVASSDRRFIWSRRWSRELWKYRTPEDTRGNGAPSRRRSASSPGNGGTPEDARGHRPDLAPDREVGGSIPSRRTNFSNRDRAPQRPEPPTSTPLLIPDARQRLSTSRPVLAASATPTPSASSCAPGHALLTPAGTPAPPTTLPTTAASSGRPPDRESVFENPASQLSSQPLPAEIRPCPLAPRCSGSSPGGPARHLLLQGLPAGRLPPPTKGGLTWVTHSEVLRRRGVGSPRAS
jgi:hypothetical protein